MRFSIKEMAAILKNAKLMALADGVMTSNEENVIKRDLASFGIKIDSLESVAIEHRADNMDGDEVISTLSNMTINQINIIGGSNDSSKSFSSKLLFCFLATLSNSGKKIENHGLYVAFDSFIR